MVLTSVATIVGGVLIYVMGKLASRFFIDPYHEYRTLLGEIAQALVYYDTVTALSALEIRNEAAKSFKQYGRVLGVRVGAIPGREFLIRHDWLLPDWEAVQAASEALNGLSNTNVDEYRDRDRYRATILKNLKLPGLS